MIVDASSRPPEPVCGRRSRGVIRSNPRHQAVFLATSGLRPLPQLRSYPARLQLTAWVFYRWQYSEYDTQRGGGVAFSSASVYRRG